ncbi:MAG: S9 family peptidase [Bacteroidales bacterium]|nr:S9 family peptidase [Bacteroidales bacterium]MDD4703540.1 S9 family peptidase [Bacteroidales bacterium]
MKKYLLFALVLTIVFVSCKPRPTKEEIVGKPEIEVKDGKLTPEVLWAFGRIGEVSVSPNEDKVLFTVKYFDVKANKGNSEIYSMNIDGSDLKQLTETSGSEWNPLWSPDGKKIGFCYADENGVQIYEMNLEGKDRKKISNIKEGDIEGFTYSPDGKKILFIRAIAKKDKYAYLKEGLDKTTGRINDDLAYRHWDNWVDAIPQPFLADFDGKELKNPINLLENTEFESPMRPWGGMEQLTFSPDSKQIVYTCRKKVGKEYAFSTNSDLYLYDISTKQTTNLTEGMMGYDQNPVFSSDGKLLAWESMERDGYEADKIRLMVMDIATKQIKDYSKDFDQNSNGLTFSKDNKSIYFISDYQGKDDIYQLTLADNSFKKITNGIHDFTSVMIAKDKLIGTKMSMSQPIEIYSVNPANGSETNISNINKDLLAKVKMGKIEERWFKATDGKDLHSWIIFPPDFDSTKKYPTILYCEGGPQSTVSQFWSYRWNFQIMAAHGYIIVAPNRRGLPGFGKEWNEQISGDYAGQCMRDYLTAIDEMCKESYVDKDCLGSVGASFGGYSVFWLAGNHNKRFKCFIAHNGMFNLEQQYLETEEMWFVNWDLGGPYWDKNNKTAQKSYANSPHKFVDKWDTPLMVIHSEFDYRIVASQGMAAYNAALIKGVPARYLYFPDESHWVLKPQNGVLWQRNFFDWLDKWLKPITKTN